MREKYEQLMLLDDESGITTQERDFLHCHKEILFNGNMAAEFVYRMTMRLKEMRDKKLYSAAGFEDFGGYTEHALGIKERQAYNYIATLESLGESFLQSNAKLGITKLSLLAAADEEVRAEVLAETDVESATVKELKEKIAALEHERDGMVEQISLLESTEHIVSSQSLPWSASELEQAQAAVKAAEDKFLEEARRANKSAEELKRLEKEKNALAAEVDALKNAPPKITADPEAEAKLAQKEAELAAKAAEVEVLNKKLAIADDPDMTKFKFLIEQFSDTAQAMFDVIEIMENSDNADKCLNAMKKLIQGWEL